MKTSKIILFATLTLTGYSANSQTSINITENNVITSKELQNVQSIKFSDGNMKLNLNNGDVTSFTLSAIQKIDFGVKNTSVVNNQTTVKSNTIIYPNPSNSNDALTLAFKSELHLPITITIYGINGAIKNQMEFTPNDAALYNFNLNNMQSGIYIAIIQQGNLIERKKLIIQ